MKSTIFIALFAFSSLCAKQIQIINLNDFGKGSLRAAINNAEDGDKIIFNEKLQGTIALGSDLPLLQKNVSILGPSSQRVSISGMGSYRIFRILAETVSIENIGILNGNTKSCASALHIEAGSRVRYKNGVISGCTASVKKGAAAYVGMGSSLFLDNVVFIGNKYWGGLGKDIWFEENSIFEYKNSGTSTTLDIYGNTQILKGGKGIVTFTIGSECPISFSVEDGEIISTGSRTGATNILTSGSLFGSQSTSYLFNQGVLNLGKSLESFNVLREFTQAQEGTLQISISPTESALLNIGEEAFLAGTLEIIPEKGKYHAGKRYTIINAGSPISTKFDKIKCSSMKFEIEYLQNSVEIKLVE